MEMDIVENILGIATVGLRFIREVWRWRLRTFVDAIDSPLCISYLPAHMQIYTFLSASMLND